MQNGERVKQLGVYLRVEQFVPYERSREMLAEVFELPLTVGSLQNFVEKAAETVKPVVAGIKEKVTKTKVVHADETGFYVAGKRHWLHTLSTADDTYLASRPNRGKKAMNEMQVIPQLTGHLVYDCWAAYFSYNHCGHVRRNSHHLRELTSVLENSQPE